MNDAHHNSALYCKLPVYYEYRILYTTNTSAVQAISPIFSIHKRRHFTKTQFHENCVRTNKVPSPTGCFFFQYIYIEHNSTFLFFCAEASEQYVTLKELSKMEPKQVITLNLHLLCY